MPVEAFALLVCQLYAAAFLEVNRDSLFPQ